MTDTNAATQTPHIDRRRKIDPTEYHFVREDYETLGSLRAVAAAWEVSFKTIWNIVNPTGYAAQKATNVENKKHKKYYNKHARRYYQQQYRARRKAAGL